MTTDIDSGAAGIDMTAVFPQILVSKVRRYPIPNCRKLRGDINSGPEAGIDIKSALLESGVKSHQGRNK